MLATMTNNFPTSGRQANGASDRRWIILVEDGRYSTLSRARDPDEDEIARAADGLARQGLSGWLAVMSGSAHADEMPTFLEVRQLGAPKVKFQDAVLACRTNLASTQS